MIVRCRFLLLGLVLLLAAFKPAAQLQPGGVSLAVDAGFDGSFRENQWMPIYVQAANDGGSVDGSIVVRPATSDGAVINTFSVPISLPQGSRKAVFLYITAQSFASQIRVEFIDNEGVVAAAQAAPLRSILARDQLYAVVTDSPTGTTDLTGVHDAGYAGFQANWSIDNIPDKASALKPINMILFSDVDTGQLSSAQRQALADWVVQGGHLVVTGGTNWQATAAGLGDLLPLIPDNSTTVDNLTPIAEWLRSSGNSNLDQQTILATGTLLAGAEVLMGTSETAPLIARRTLGSGTVDYIAVSPNTQPLRGWGGMTELWLELATSVSSQPSWTYGVHNWDAASTSVNVLPGINLLPDILPLIGFLALYIALIGPLNYIILNRLNRRELAWVTIPLFIIAFSVLAWIVGFNLRGNEVTVSRLTVVETWPDTDRAHVQQLLGLLSPRRAQYSVNISDGSFLRPLPQFSQGGLLRGVQTGTDIQQTDIFLASDFSVDASFIAGFEADTVIEKPAINGQASLTYDQIDGQQIMRGSVRNDTPQTIQDGMILVRGQTYALNNPLMPGDVATFELTLAGEGLPSPAPLSYAPGAFRDIYYRSYYYQSFIDQSIRDVMGDKLLSGRNTFSLGASGATAQQETYRRQMFLTSFINDPYETVTGRGDKAYLIGWTNTSPLDITLEGGNWQSLDTTLYIVELDVTIEQPASQAVISGDRFTWFVRERNSLTDLGPVEMTLQPGDRVTFRFTPLPGAVLREVNELTVIVDRNSNSSRTVPLLLWNWEEEAWEDIAISGGNSYSIRNPQRFLGPENAVEVQVNADSLGNYTRIQDISIEHRGRF